MPTTKKNKFIRIFSSNLGFIMTLIFLGVIVLNPKAKGFVLSGLIKTGLYKPNVSDKNEEFSATIAPPVLFTSSKGRTLNLANLKGKVVFINFWATWCPPCIAEMPSINQLNEKFIGNKDVIFLVVDVDNNPEKSQKFMKQNKYDLHVYTANAMPEQLFQGSLPTTLILNKKGEIVYNHEGMADYDSPEIEKFLNDLSKLN